MSRHLQNVLYINKIEMLFFVMQSFVKVFKTLLLSIGSFHVKPTGHVTPPYPNLMKFGTEATFHEKIMCSKLQLKISYGSRDIDTWSQALFGLKFSAPRNFHVVKYTFLCKILRSLHANYADLPFFLFYCSLTKMTLLTKSRI